MALIALGVTGGISAYKAVEVARGLQERRHDVVAIMTPAACRFVGPLTFEAITRRRVITDQFEVGANADIEHISLATEIDALLVAPATANVIAKLAHGIADDFLTSLYLATRVPVVVAPAMNTNMFDHEAVTQNLEVLHERGVHVIAPSEGYLACGWEGKGRLAEPLDVVEAVDTLFRSHTDLIGRRVVVSAGPTFEDIDPVRFVGNRSSGRMGIALAAEAVARRGRVVLVLGPCALEPPREAEVIRVRSAAEMHAAMMHHAEEADVIVMAAAVADYTVKDGRQAHKLSRDTDDRTVTLTRTTDILAALGAWRGVRSHPVLVGFAAETRDVVSRAQTKLKTKRVDLIVANDVSRGDAGFEVETNVATLVTPDTTIPVPLQSKRSLAGVILDRVQHMLAT